VWQLIVCGQALSHCVNFTFCDILDTWPEAERARLVLLTDACSTIAGHEAAAARFLQFAAAAGCTLATTAGCSAALGHSAAAPSG
jgi:nicotinamidase-related amidase